MLHRAGRHAVVTIVLISIVSIALLPSSAAAQVAPSRTSSLARLSLSDPRLRLTSTADPLEQVAPLVPAELRDGWARFTIGTGGSRQACADPPPGRAGAGDGAGLPGTPADRHT